MQPGVRLAEDRPVTADDEASAGRALIEDGRPVAGSMCQGAASVLFSPATAAVQLDAALVACLRATAIEATAVPLHRERVRAGAVLAFAVEHAATLERAGRVVRADGFFTDRRAGRP